MKILLVTSDKALRGQLHQALLRHRLIVDVASNGVEAWDLLQTFLYDLVLLEALLPEIPGLMLCRRLRSVGNPVLLLLMIEAGDSETLIQGLELGADACLSKPIREPELLAHLNALARRNVRRASPALAWGPLLLDPTARRVTCQGQDLKLNRKQYQLVELFLGQPRRMFSRSEIGDRLWPLDEQIPTEATIKTYLPRVETEQKMKA